MLIGLIVTGIIIFLIISSYLRRSREADEKTLRPMSEWVILANSGNSRNREKMAYSLIVQASAILENQKILPHNSLRSLMISKPELCKSNFVLLIMESALDVSPSDSDFIKKSFKTEQARIYLAQCIGLIIHKTGEHGLAEIALASCGEPFS
ncbi:hypothetical protein [Acinetobacter haemolyticus]|uniref:hypothetical protein n=1 Tax=Acinetobacter haemolyticus TaxID=29430 RepID=UPI0021CE1234|nr:hypothetical protein [Acinetobacter haemolyticus]MCU4387227.1 hypothetical protein [Acinetobacter haemolyticus]